jgi:hypothetical protein
MSLLDSETPDAEDSRMSPKDQHNITLQIAATEARMETRQSEIRGELAAINEWFTGRDQLYEAGFAAIDARFLSIEQAIRDLAHAISRLRTTVIVTAITVGLTTTLGVAAINAPPSSQAWSLPSIPGAILAPYIPKCNSKSPTPLLPMPKCSDRLPISTPP